ncbi:hypothetical protein BJV82DRAFT_109570 [Fennellomyces sp. T-0311]|nr:hypothetical protein BJV82DRAFT_109570 [Fennellomyces sp. T-0311]
MPALPGFAPIPHVGLLLFVAKFALVILVSEFMTSQIHSSCNARLLSVPGVYIRTNHSMKRRRRETPVTHSRGRNIKWCVDDEGAWLHRQEWCPNGRYHAGQIWSVKQCTNHPNAVMVDRDLNAARNMRRIGVSYMMTNGDPLHRPPPLRRNIIHPMIGLQ